MKYGRTNEFCAVMTPIKLPTWGHIAQMAAIARPTKCVWSFFKADHAIVYKQLPLGPSDRAKAVVALRDPASGKWFGFAPRTLLFGAVAAALHYNAFSRAVAKVFTRVTGIPLLSYFDDFGALVPLEVLEAALAAFVRFCEMSAITLKPEKTDMGPALTSLGIFGAFPSPSNDMSLTVALPREKALAWRASVEDILSAGSVVHKDLERVIGRLAFTQTSVYGRAGRAMLTVLYQKLNAHFYSPILSGREQSTLRWWQYALLTITPRLTKTRGPQTDLVIYTGAATTTMIIAAVIAEPAIFVKTRTLTATLSLRAGKHWAKLFETTALIYGLEMLAIFAVLFDPVVDLRGRNITFYVDNNNALAALVSNAPGPPVIAAMTQLIWLCILELGIAAWFERVPSKRNIADLPTKRIALPFASLQTMTFRCLRRCFELITRTERNIKNGIPADTILEQTHLGSSLSHQ